MSKLAFPPPPHVPPRTIYKLVVCAHLTTASCRAGRGSRQPPRLEAQLAHSLCILGLHDSQGPTLRLCGAQAGESRGRLQWLACRPSESARRPREVTTCALPMPLPLAPRRSAAAPPPPAHQASQCALGLVEPLVHVPRPLVHHLAAARHLEARLVGAAGGLDDGWEL